MALPMSINDIKSKIREKIPSFISDTLNNYSCFSSSAVPEDSKGFAAYHAACKAALAHIEELLKIAKLSADDEKPIDLTNDSDESKTKTDWQTLARKALQETFPLEEDDMKEESFN